MRFVDEIEINAKAGNGGDGAVSFLHTHLNPLSGPDGGAGGAGGNVYFKGSKDINSLHFFSFKRKWNASSGSNGGKNLKKGRDGEDLYIKVPLGTSIYIVEKSEKIFFYEIMFEGETVIASKGGKGGLGNYSFKSSTNRSPKYRQKGSKTEEIRFYLELKIIADLGFVGLPSCGKSTLLNSLTNSNSKTGDFDFTTLTPQLGTVEFDNSKNNLIIADLPGIIKNSSKNKGLGFKFLKHISHCKKLFYVIDSTKKDFWKENLQVLKNEINSSPFENEKIDDDRESVIIFNKIDMLDENDVSELKKSAEINLHEKFFLVSALKDQGTLLPLINFIKESFPKKSEKISKEFINQKKNSLPFHQIYDFTKNIIDIDVRKIKKSLWIVSGYHIEKLLSGAVSIEVFESEVSKLFESSSVEDILYEKGVKKGDILIINDKEYIWK